MKILKIFGIVAGIHLFALILIFANPGCSSTSKPPPTPAQTAAPAATPAAVSYPAASTPVAAPSEAITFNPDAPATASPVSVASGASNVRFTPTRPGSPAAGTLVQEPISDVTPASTYTVVSGDNLWNVAKKHHLSVAEIAAVNNIKTTAVLRPGQKLIIPARSSLQKAVTPAAPASAAPETARPVAAKTPPAQSVTHVVKLGETLGSIARRYGVKQGDIAVANNITDPQKIRAGTELIIPGWQAPSGKSAKSSAKGKKAEAGSSAESAPQPEPAVEKPAPTPEVPVIRVDDSPISPAPKT